MPQYDVTVYCLHILTGVLGPARRVTALSGIAIPMREHLGKEIVTEMDDQTIMMLDFGGTTYAIVYATVAGGLTKGFFPNIYGTEGSIVGLKHGDQVKLGQTLLAYTAEDTLENVIFANRKAVVALFLLLTVFMLWQATHLEIDAGFAKLLPLEHPDMKTYLQYRQQFGGANRVLVALIAKDGDMFDPEFFETLKNATDAVFFIPGVDRPKVHPSEAPPFTTSAPSSSTYRSRTRASREEYVPWP